VAGHGGPNAASFVKSTLFESLLTNPKYSTDIKTALGMTFLVTPYNMTASGVVRREGGGHLHTFG